MDENLAHKPFPEITSSLYNTVQNPGSLSSPRPLAAAALPRKLFLVFLVSECVLHPPWLGLLVRIGVGWWWKSSAWWRGRGKAPP